VSIFLISRVSALTTSFWGCYTLFTGDYHLALFAIQKKKGEAPMRAAVMEEQELTVDEVAKRLRISYWTARRRCLSGKIPYRLEGHFIRVSESDLQEYIQGTKQQRKEPRDTGKKVA
jgi:excisionase family DNA binding protein